MSLCYFCWLQLPGFVLVHHGSSENVGCISPQLLADCHQILIRRILDLAKKMGSKVFDFLNLGSFVNPGTEYPNRFG